MKSRVTKMAVNTDVTMPTSKVTPNPLTGPDPKANRINAVMPVVIFASKMADSAFS